MTEAWLDVAPSTGWQLGSLRRISVGGENLCVGRGEAGFFALDDFCPHAGGSLAEGMLDGNDVVCPLHAYGFDIRTGACSEDLRGRSRVYPVRERDGRIQVRR